MNDTQLAQQGVIGIVEIKNEPGLLQGREFVDQPLHLGAVADDANPSLAASDRREKTVAKAGQAGAGTIAVLSIDDIDHTRLVTLGAVDARERHGWGIGSKKNIRIRIDTGQMGLDACIKKPLANEGSGSTSRSGVGVDDDDVIVAKLILGQVVLNLADQPSILLRFIVELDELNEIINARMFL